jgi:hypothetical protein
VDGLFSAAMKSATVTATVDGKPAVLINPITAHALLDQRLAAYQQIEARIAEVKVAQGKVSKNASNASAYLAGLRQYFDTQEQAAQASVASGEALQTLLVKLRGLTATAGP